jgi:hypothetical protein
MIGAIPAPPMEITRKTMAYSGYSLKIAVSICFCLNSESGRGATPMENPDDPVIPAIMDSINNKTDGPFSSDQQAEFEARVAKRKIRHPDPMLPPWSAAPELPYGSLGWRMGSGEDYRVAFSNWFSKLSLAEYENYVHRNPEPKSWNGFYNIIRKRP